MNTSSLLNLVKGTAGRPKALGQLRERSVDPVARARLVERFDLAQNALERTAAGNVERLLKREILFEYPDPQQRRFIFRCYWIPRYCIEVLKSANNNWPSRPPLWLWEHAAYLLAFERTHWEMVLRKDNGGNIEFHGSRWITPVAHNQMPQLPLPGIQWFEEPGGDFGYWEGRFDAWRGAVLRSLAHRYQLDDQLLDGTFCAGMSGTALARSRDSHILPGLEGTLTRHFESLGQSHLSTFRKFSAAAPPTKRSMPSVVQPVNDEDWLEAWLIELWPLVENRRWGRPMVRELAKRKFGRGHHLLASSRKFSARSEKLDLLLDDSLSKGGATKKARSPEKLHNEFTAFAVHLKSMAELGESWLLGQRHLVRSKAP